MMFDILDEQSLALDDSVISGGGSGFESEKVQPNNKWFGVIHILCSVGYT